MKILNIIYSFSPNDDVLGDLLKEIDDTLGKSDVEVCDSAKKMVLKFSIQTDESIDVVRNFDKNLKFATFII